MPRGVRRTIKVPKAPSVALQLLAGKTRGAPPREEVDEEDFFHKDWSHLREDYKRNRENFCREYIKDFNGSQAMLRMGFKLGKPWIKASEWLSQEYTQWFLGKLMQKLDDKAIVTRTEILLGLKREAHHYGLDGSAAARIAAWRTMGKILGLEVTKVEANLNMPGGVMVLPFSGSPEEWEKAAAAAQEKLKKTVRV